MGGWMELDGVKGGDRVTVFTYHTLPQFCAYFCSLLPGHVAHLAPPGFGRIGKEGGVGFAMLFLHAEHGLAQVLLHRPRHQGLRPASALVLEDHKVSQFLPEFDSAHDGRT